MLNIFQQGQFGRRRFGVAAGATDPDFASGVTLLHMDGSNGSTSFPDSSSQSVSWTATGSGVAVRTAQSKFGGASAGFDATGANYISATDADLALGTGNFTVEVWFRRTDNLTGYQAVYIFGSTDKGLYVQNNNFFLYDGGAVGSFATSLDTWHFFEVGRSGTTVYVFADGNLNASDTRSTNYSSTTHRIGSNLSAGENLHSAYVDEVRVTKGVCRHTASYTPPTAAFPNS